MQEATVLLQLKIEKAVSALPNAGKAELLSFLDYLQHKYQVGTDEQIIKLGGIWADIEFEISEEELQNLRREVSNQILDRFTKLKQ